MKTPLVSVIIPTFNYAHTIDYALQSVLNQTYPANKIEIIIVDDGSTDNTLEVVKPYLARENIKYIYQENKGKSSATFIAIDNAFGEIIFNLDADDTYFPDKICNTVKTFQLFPNVVHVSSPAQINYKNQQSINEDIPEFLLNKSNSGLKVLEYFLSKNIVFGGGSTFSCLTSLIKQVKLPQSANMYIDELLLIAILTKGDTYFHKKPMSIWNIHEQNYSFYNSNDQNRVQKNIELLKSSQCILNYLTDLKINSYLVKLYFLKHQTRNISFKEFDNKKNLKDIIIYFHNCFILNSFQFSIYISYHSFQRLVPNYFIRFFKKFIKK